MIKNRLGFRHGLKISTFEVIDNPTTTEPIFTPVNVVPWANQIEAEAGKISFCTFNPDLAGQTIANGSTLFRMKFNILGPTTGVPAFGFADSPTLAEMVDGNLVP